MNKHDRDNLKFLMNCPQDQFEAWMETATPDDVDYALELIRRAKTEMMVEQIELQECVELEDFDEANAIINRIKNVGKTN